MTSKNFSTSADTRHHAHSRSSVHQLQTVMMGHDVRPLRWLVCLIVLLRCHVLSWTSYIVGRSTGVLYMSDTPTSQSTALNAVKKSSLVLDSGIHTIRSRLVSLTDDWNVTVWEWDEPAAIMEHYWSVQQNFVSQQKVLDPFGLVSWPGAVVAAQEMLTYKSEIENSTVLVLGAGPGVEAQALAMLGAKKVIASDIHPTTLQLLRYGAQQAGLGGIIQGQVLDVCSDEPLPDCDIMIAADVLYNANLASHVGRRCREALGKRTKILVTDSQRFSDFVPELSKHFPVSWEERILHGFTGSGVMVNEDQTYNVTARVLAAGW